MAGVPGFEPGYAGIKNQCLTAWRYPNKTTSNCIFSCNIKDKTRKMAGVPGFEPGNAGIKNQCLTAWRYPNCAYRYQEMVREARLELAHLAALEPKSSASTNFATPA